MKRIIIICFGLFLILLFVPLIACIGNMDTSDTKTQLNEENSYSTVSLPETGNDNLIDDTQSRFILYDQSSGENISLTEKDYIFGAVASEMPASYDIEALKAQAIACYTTAIRNRMLEKQNPTSSLNGAHFTCDLSKNYGYITEDKLRERWGEDYQQNYDKIMEAVNAVYGKVIVYDDQPILAAYHAISNGKTEKSGVIWQSDLPYLKTVDSSFDKDAQNYHTTVTYTKEEIISLLDKQYNDFKYNKADPLIEIIKKSEVGTVTSVYAGNLELTGSQLRTTLNLRSSCFTISEDENNITFDVYGYGHGVGMSQYGAGYLAHNGKSYEEIIKHYYSGVEIVDISDLSL